jgi:hypothetical protein
MPEANSDNDSAYNDTVIVAVKKVYNPSQSDLQS